MGKPRAPRAPNYTPLIRLAEENARKGQALASQAQKALSPQIANYQALSQTLAQGQRDFVTRAYQDQLGTARNIANQQLQYGNEAMQRSLGTAQQVSDRQYGLADRAIDDNLAATQTAARRQYGLANSGLRDQLAYTTGMTNRLLENNQRVSAAQMGRAVQGYNQAQPAIRGQLGLSNTLRERYTAKGIPMEDAYINRLNTWDSPQRRSEAMGMARADVNENFAAQRANQMRQLESYGIDPSQVRSGSLDARMRSEQAVASASAGTQASRGIEREGLGMQGMAVDLMRGSLGASQQALGAGVTAQNAVLGGTQAASALGMQGLQSAATFGQQGRAGAYGQALGAYGQAGNTLTQGTAGAYGQGLQGYGQAGQALQTGTQAANQTGMQGVGMYGDTLFNGQNSAYGMGLTGYAGANQAQLGGLGAGIGMYGDLYGLRGNLIYGGTNSMSGAYGAASNIYGNQINAYNTQLANSPLNTLAGLGGMWMGAGMPGIGFEDGGYVGPGLSPSGGAIPDDVPARVNVGEVILPEEVVRYHGLKTINKLAEEATGTGIPMVGAR